MPHKVASNWLCRKIGMARRNRLHILIHRRLAIFFNFQEIHHLHRDFPKTQKEICSRRVVGDIGRGSIVCGRQFGVRNIGIEGHGRGKGGNSNYSVMDPHHNNASGNNNRPFMYWSTTHAESTVGTPITQQINTSIIEGKFCDPETPSHLSIRRMLMT